ncbi:hypothetical protein D3C72_2467630 [compost metagenome]
MKNNDIREALKFAHIYQYELASALKISEMTLIKRLRNELSKQDKEKIYQTIKQLKKQ